MYRIALLPNIDVWFYLQLLLIVLITGSTAWIWDKWTYWDRRGVPNTGPLAQFFAYRNRTAGDVEIEWYQKYGGVYGVYKYFTPTLTVGTLQHSKNLLTRDFKNFRNHTPFHSVERRLDQNFFLYRDDYWKKMRGISGPVFSPVKLRGMAVLILECVDTFVTNISELDGSPISIKKYLDCLAMDVIVSCVYGIKINCLKDPSTEIVIQAKEIFQVFMKSFGFFGAKFIDLSCLDYISKLTLDLVTQRRTENEETRKKRQDFLQVMVDAKYSEGGALLTDDQICAFGLSFFSDGFESTSNMMTAMIFYLATNQRVQSKLFEEISTLSEVNVDSVSGLKYLDAVVKETFRLWPGAFRNDRYCEEEYKLEGTDIVIPAGMSVDIPVYAMQRDPKYFPDPHEFKPERYMAGGTNEELSPVSILTFGAGPRQCIAIGFVPLEIKLTMSKVLSKIKFVSTPHTKLENLDGETVFLFPKDVFVTLEPREADTSDDNKKII